MYEFLVIWGQQKRFTRSAIGNVLLHSLACGAGGATGAVRFIVLFFLCMIRMAQLQKIVSCQVPCSPAGVREIPSTGIARSPGITNPLRLASTGSGKATVRDLPLTAGFRFA